MRMVTCIYVAESLLCLPEVSTTVLIGYMPILIKKLNKIHHVQIPETYRKESHKQLYIYLNYCIYVTSFTLVQIDHRYYLCV